MSLYSSASGSMISFQFSGPNGSGLLRSVSSTDMRNVSQPTTTGAGQSNKKSRVIEEILKLMDDSISQRHIVLQQHCLRALDENFGEYHHEMFDLPELDPVSEICIINEKLGEKLPRGFEAISTSLSGLDAHIFRSSGSGYVLCIKRRKQTDTSPQQSMADSEDSVNGPAWSPEDKAAGAHRYISDVRLVRTGEVPYGFYPITKTAYGAKVSGPWVFCYSNHGAAQILDFAFIFPSQDEKVPTGSILIKADLGEGNSDGTEMYLTVRRDIQPYFADLQNCSCAPSSNHISSTNQLNASSLSLQTLMDDPKFLPPFLSACHLMEPVLGTVALLSLQKLIEEGFILDPSDRDTRIYISTIVRSVNDALCTSDEPNFQMELLNLLRIIINKFCRMLSVEMIYHIIVASFRVSSKGIRLQFLEFFMEALVKGSSTSGNVSGGISPRSSDNSPRHTRQRTAFSMSSSYRPTIGQGTSTEEGCRTIALELVENVVTAKHTEQLVKKFRALSIFSPSFVDVITSSVGFLFPKPSERNLGAAILVLSKVAMESESNTVALKYKFGVSRKHSGLRILLFVLDRMYEAGGGILRKHTSGTDITEEERILAMESNSLHKDLKVPVDLNATFRGPVLEGHQMNKTFAYLFRRYVCPTFFTSLLPVERAGSPDQPSIQSFNLILAFFTVLSDRYARFFKNELGVFLSDIVLELAENSDTQVERRYALVGTLKSMLEPVKKVVSLYYNYDNISNWPLMERTVEVMGNILMETKKKDNVMDGNIPMNKPTRSRMGTVEFDSALSLVDMSVNDDEEDGCGVREHDEEEEEKTNAMSSNSNNSNNSNNNNNNNNNNSTNSNNNNNSNNGYGISDNGDGLSETGSETGGTVFGPHLSSEAYISLHAHMSTVDPNTGAKLDPHDVLKVACLEVLVIIIRNAEEWFVRQSEREKLEQLQENCVSNGKSGLYVGEYDSWDNLPISDMRKNTVMHRQKKNAGNKDLLKRALRLAKTKSLGKALAFLEGVNYVAHDAEAHVMFIVTQSALRKLTPEMVGEYLGGKRPKVEELFMEEVRLNYIRRLSMFNLSIVQALRRFLVDGGFRLPSEAQKIERMLESFSDVYVEENPNAFKDADACYVMATAILMLNTSLHNPNLKEKDRLTRTGFVKMCGGIEGTGLDQNDYEAIFDNILSDGFKIELTANIHTREKQKGGGGGGVVVSANQQAREKYARTLTACVRRAETFMTNHALFHPSFISAYSPNVAVSLWQTTWMQFSYILSNVLNSHKETRMVSICLDGFKYALRLATRLGKPSHFTATRRSDEEEDNSGQVERESFIQALAKFSFHFQNDMSDNPTPRSVVNINIVKGHHMEQEWVQTMISLSADPLSSIPTGEVIDDLKKEYIREKNFKELRGVQKRLSGDENVVTPGRYFIREGGIGKLCGNGEKRQYRLFLFSDALLYASETGTSQSYKTHRVIMLAFASLHDIHDSPSRKNMFHVISPQKTVIFFAHDARSKQAWLDAIRRGIQKEKNKRQRIIRTVRMCASHPKGTPVPQSTLSRIENTAAFLHRDPESIRAGDLAMKNVVDGHCHLCLREFSFFNRSQRCPMCLDHMCGKCITRKVAIPATKRKAKICDGCYGLTKQFENRKQALLHSVSLEM